MVLLVIIFLIVIGCKIIRGIQESNREPKNLNIDEMFDDAVVEGKDSSEIKKKYRKGYYFY